VLGRKRRISFLLLFGHSLAFVWTDSSGRKNFHPSFPAVGRRVIQQVEKHEPLFHQGEKHWNRIKNKSVFF